MSKEDIQSRPGRKPRTAKPTSISVVTPCYNEELVVHELHRRLTSVLEKVGLPYEIILVDDGSKDNTWPLLTELREKDRHLKIVRLARNFGHQLALTCGLDQAHGEVILIMDADLQDPPE
ncbi:MAG: glycosyltransferase family 2 protein, partial [Bdellovibrionales bacterium]|nr:glycosyltransferase family 2 protein [Bdellovibrionales bacterium]